LHKSLPKPKKSKNQAFLREKATPQCQKPSQNQEATEFQEYYYQGMEIYNSKIEVISFVMEPGRNLTTDVNFEVSVET
jgi:hypothetical protein